MYSLKALYIRVRMLARVSIQLSGLALACLGAYNLMLAPLGVGPTYAPYRVFGPVGSVTDAAYYAGDALVILPGLQSRGYSPDGRTPGDGRRTGRQSVWAVGGVLGSDD